MNRWVKICHSLAIFYIFLQYLRELPGDHKSAIGQNPFLYYGVLMIG
jgi:hypothetical protein